MKFSDKEIDQLFKCKWRRTLDLKPVFMIIRQNETSLDFLKSSLANKHAVPVSTFKMKVWSRKF